MKSWFLIALLLAHISAHAGEWPSTLAIYRGTTPDIDGKLSPGEWDDATSVTTAGWTPSFNPVDSTEDLSAVFWLKHDGKDFYLAARIVDDIAYGIDTPRWLPDENALAHELSREGYPWFGDGIEWLMNPRYEWSRDPGQDVDGTGGSWQMVVNATKGWKEGVGRGGLLQGEPRALESAWYTYTEWLENGAMRAAVAVFPEANAWTIEWHVQADPCLEVRPGVFWNPEMGITLMGLNLAVQDLDQKARGKGNFGNLNHEQWWAGTPEGRTNLREFGTLVVHPDQPSYLKAK